MTTTTHHAVAVAILALTLSPSPAGAGVTYRLDTGLPPGTGITAFVEFAGPASATSGWTITDPADIVSLAVLDVPYVTGASSRTTLIEVGASPFLPSFLPFSSSTGAHPDRGSILAIGSWWYGVPTVAFDFGPGGSGSVDVVHGANYILDRNLSVSASGTWVLVPATVPAPPSAVLLLIGLAAAAWPAARGG